MNRALSFFLISLFKREVSESRIFVIILVSI